MALFSGITCISEIVTCLIKKKLHELAKKSALLGSLFYLFGQFTDSARDLSVFSVLQSFLRQM